jgi:hypothetical protein
MLVKELSFYVDLIMYLYINDSKSLCTKQAKTIVLFVLLKVNNLFGILTLLNQEKYKLVSIIFDLNQLKKSLL